jgi:hypothetical protein
MQHYISRCEKGNADFFSDERAAMKKDMSELKARLDALEKPALEIRPARTLAECYEAAMKKDVSELTARRDALEMPPSEIRPAVALAEAPPSTAPFADGEQPSALSPTKRERSSSPLPQSIKGSPAASPKPAKSLPRAGELWTFTGNVDRIPVYSDDSASILIHELSCSQQSGGRLRCIEILTSATEKSQYVNFRGTQNLHWLEGWIAMRDDHCRWNIRKRTGGDQDDDCTFA